MSRPLTILCVDDNVLLLAMRKALLESSDFKVFTAASGPVGLEIVHREQIDVAILDYKLPGMDGGEVARELRRSYPNVAIILSSGMQDIAESVLLIMDGIVPKGASSAALIKEIERVTTARPRLPEQFPRIQLDGDDSVEHSRGFRGPKQLRRRSRQNRSS